MKQPIATVASTVPGAPVVSYTALVADNAAPRNALGQK